MKTCHVCGMEYADAGGALACPRCGAGGSTLEIDHQEAGWYRFLGIISVIAGGALGYVGILQPLRDAMEQRLTVTLWAKAIWLAPVLLLGGLFYCVAPRHAYQLLGRRQITVSGVISAVVIFLVSLTVSAALEMKLHAMGYTRP
jgi:hypothetical protein